MQKLIPLVFVLVFLCLTTTMDAQYDWKLEHPYPDGSSLTEASLEDVHFLDSTRGFIVGDDGSVLRTLDGKTWEYSKISPPPDRHGRLYAIASSGDSIIYIAGGEGLFYYSTDMGETWIDRSMGIDFVIAKLVVTEPSVIWAIGAVDVTSGGSSYHGVIRKSENGGKHWTTVAVVHSNVWPDLHNYLLDMQFTSRDTAYVVGTQKTIIKSVNGGESWEYLSPDYPDYYSLHFFSNDEGFCAGDMNSFSYTSDGGVSWETISHQGGYVYDVDFVDDMRGWAVGFRIQSTSDGGLTWSRDAVEPFPKPGPGFNSIHLVNDHEGWIVGGKGAIYHTETGGVVSIDQTPTPSAVILSVSPQPLSSGRQSTIQVSLPVPASVNLIVYDLLGRLVQTVHEGQLSSGQHRLDLMMDDVKPGIYFLRMTAGEQQLTRKLLIQ